MSFNRETIFAIVAGFALGLLTAWGVWTISQTRTKQETSIITQQTPPPQPKSTFSLSISKPEDGATSITSEASVSGKTQKDATVVISGPLEEKIAEVDSEGAFSETITLEEGTNEIVITAYPSDSTSEGAVETRVVNFTKEEF